MYVLVQRFFCFKLNTAYEMRISDWSSDVCSSDLAAIEGSPEAPSDLKAHRLVTEEILAGVTPEHYEEVTASGAVFNKLYMPSRPELWGKWLEGYGAPVGQAGLRFENYSIDRKSVV